MRLPKKVGPETVARLRCDYPEETEALNDDHVLERYGYAGHKYEAPGLWDDVGDAEYDYDAAADELERLRTALTTIRDMGHDCPAATDPEHFYRNGMAAMVAVAAKALGESQ